MLRRRGGAFLGPPKKVQGEGTHDFLPQLGGVGLRRMRADALHVDAGEACRRSGSDRVYSTTSAPTTESHCSVIGLPGAVGATVVTFAGVNSNFAGVPLALAFVFTIGNNGLITVLLRDTFGFSLAETGFSIYSIAGLSLVYLYFQLPLMVLIIAPAIEGLRREWREAAENMGASAHQYWLHVALPVLMPSILGTVILLFGNAFGAQATAFQLTGGTIPIAPVVIGAQIRGDVPRDPGLGYAMAMGMVVVMAVSIGMYSWLQRRAERWLRS